MMTKPLGTHGNKTGSPWTDILNIAIIATVAICYLTMLLILILPSIHLERNIFEILGYLGGFITGIANIIMIIWLIATLAQQRRDLGSQIDTITKLSSVLTAQFQQQLYKQVYSAAADEARNIALVMMPLERSSEIKVHDTRYISGMKDEVAQLILDDRELRSLILVEKDNPVSAIKIYLRRFHANVEAMNRVIEFNGGVGQEISEIYKTSVMRDLYEFTR